MSWLLIVGLKNALLIAPLALLALGLSRWCRRPALAHLVWVLVLVKLLTPPLIDVPVGWQLDVEGWVAAAAPDAEPLFPPDASARSADLTQVDLFVARCPEGAASSDATASAKTQSQFAGEGTIARSASGGTVARRASNATLAQGAGEGLSGASIACDATAHNSIGRPIAAAAASSSIGTTASRFLPDSVADWLLVAAGIWLMGSAAIAVQMAWRWWQFRRFLRLAGREDPRLARRIGQLARAAGLAVQPTVRIVDSAVSPMLWGLGSRATLIFPAQLAERLEEDEIDSLLLHELAHFARGDHWVRLLELATHIGYWWHPVVWWARREIEAAEEACCDAWVVEHQAGSRRSYAEALLATIDFLSEQTPALPPAACGLGDVPLLRQRLQQIIRGETAGRMSRVAQAIVLCAGVILSPLQPALWATSSQRRPAAAPPTVATRPVAPLPAILPEDDPASLAPQPAPEPIAPAEEPKAEPPAAEMVLPPPAPLFATARSPNAKYRLEARYGRRAALIREGTNWKLDLSSYRIECASFAPDSRSFVTGHEDGTLSWWDSETGGRLASYRVGSDKVTSVAFARNGTSVACGLAAEGVAIWDLTTGQPTAALSGLPRVNCVRWSRGGDRLAISTGSFQAPEQSTLLIWNPLAPQPQHELALHSPAGAIEWAAGDESLVHATWNGAASAWHFASESVTAPVALGKDAVSAASWSPDIPLADAWKLNDLAQGVLR